MTKHITRIAAAALAAVTLTIGIATTSAVANVTPTDNARVSTTLNTQRESGTSIFTVHKDAAGRLAITALDGAMVSPPADTPHLVRPQFSPTCVGSGCNGLDPVTQSNCSQGGYAVSGYSLSTSQDAGYGDINLMYQNYCKANWAEADHLAAGVCRVGG